MHLDPDPNQREPNQCGPMRIRIRSTGTDEQLNCILSQIQIMVVCRCTVRHCLVNSPGIYKQLTKVPLQCSECSAVLALGRQDNILRATIEPPAKVNGRLGDAQFFSVAFLTDVVKIAF
jgi:hypothetical protein